MKIGELCTRVVAIADPELPVTEAARRMREHHVGDLVVVEPAEAGENEPVGVITDRDLVIEVMADNLDRAASMKVGEVMTCELVSVRDDEDVDAVLRKMRAAGVRRAPVVNERGALVGIITYDDLLEWLVEELGGLVGVVERQRRIEVERGQHGR
jgi:CBS domain-containing protein